MLLADFTLCAAEQRWWVRRSHTCTPGMGLQVNHTAVWSPHTCHLIRVLRRGNKWSYVAEGTLTVAIVEEDTGRCACCVLCSLRSLGF